MEAGFTRIPRRLIPGQPSAAGIVVLVDVVCGTLLRASRSVQLVTGSTSGRSSNHCSRPCSTCTRGSSRRRRPWCPVCCKSRWGDRQTALRQDRVLVRAVARDINRSGSAGSDIGSCKPTEWNRYPWNGCHAPRGRGIHACGSEAQDCAACGQIRYAVGTDAHIVDSANRKLRPSTSLPKEETSRRIHDPRRTIRPHRDAHRSTIHLLPRTDVSGAWRKHRFVNSIIVATAISSDDPNIAVGPDADVGR